MVNSRVAAYANVLTLLNPQSSMNEFDDSTQVVTKFTTDNPLAGTAWHLVEFQSMDDATGTVRPDDPSLYTMRLSRDGTVTMQLNCNRARGTWSVEPGSDTVSGRFKFGSLAATRALCPPPSMDESIMAQSKFVRSYLLKDGKLHLSLMADGGIYVWTPDTGKSSSFVVPKAPEDGGPRNCCHQKVRRSHPRHFLPYG
jgi:heat shock protein HslJ